MGAIASQITSLTIVYSTLYSGADQSKHQSSASLAFVRGIHRGPVNSPHKWPVTRKMFRFDDVIIAFSEINYFFGIWWIFLPSTRSSRYFFCYWNNALRSNTLRFKSDALISSLIYILIEQILYARAMLNTIFSYLKMINDNMFNYQLVPIDSRRNSY